MAEPFLLLKGLCVLKTHFVGQSPLSLSLTGRTRSGARGGIWPWHGGGRGAGCYHLGVRVYLFAVDGVCARVWAPFLSALPSSSVAVGAPPLWTPPSHGLISLPTDLEFPVHVSLSTPTTATAKDFAYTLPCM